MNGIDISSYQGSLDLNNISYDFVLIKATEGVSYVNPMCDTHFQEAKAAGKKRALYHFTNFGNPIAEADFFVDNCAGYIRDAIFVLDWEGSSVGATDWALEFLQHVESRIGYKPAIYMSEWVENHYDWTAVVGNDNGLWIAKYSDYEIDNNYDMSGAGQPPNLLHWPFYFMWQWTSKGRLNGYAGDLDCDIAYLDAQQWDLYAGFQQPTTTTTTTEAPAVETSTTTTTTVGNPVPDQTDTQHQAAGPTTTTTTTVAAGTTVINDPMRPTTTPIDYPPVDDPPVNIPVTVNTPKVVVNSPRPFELPPAVTTQISLFEAVGRRAFNTFWQAFVATFGASLTGVASGVLNIYSFSDAKAFALSVVVAALAAALSALKNTLNPPTEVKGVIK
jgi:lysozyme